MLIKYESCILIIFCYNVYYLVIIKVKIYKFSKFFSFVVCSLYF